MLGELNQNVILYLEKAVLFDKHINLRDLSSTGGFSDFHQKGSVKTCILTRLQVFECLFKLKKQGRRGWCSYLGYLFFSEGAKPQVGPL